MQRYRSSLTRHFLGWFVGTAWLAAAGVAAADSDLKIAYHGSRCEPEQGDRDRRKSFRGYEARDYQSIVCPINREGTTVDGLPAVAVEAYNAELASSAAADFSCALWWLEEDGAGTTRGVTQVQETTQQGNVQFAFNDLSDFEELAGEGTLTSGGEGTLLVRCDALTQEDRLIQYQVTENSFVL
jgi:hypothetical protein